MVSRPARGERCWEKRPMALKLSWLANKGRAEERMMVKEQGPHR